MATKKLGTLRTTPKDVFLQLLMMVMLYISIISLISISFAYIDYWFPDPLSFYAESILGTIRYSSAMLIVAAPLLLVFSWLIQKDLRNNPEKHNLSFRKWLVYITLFVAAITLVIDLIQLVYRFYSGELTVPFSLKVLSILVFAGAVFAYYVWDVQNEPHHSKVPARTGWGFGAAVIAILVLGFVVVGSPMKQREIRMDEQRISHLQMLQSEIVNQWQLKETLPASLDELNNNITGYMVPTDPVTLLPYEYMVKDDLVFELCATFSHPDPYKGDQNSNMRNMYMYPNYLGNAGSIWDHEAGRACFERSIDPALFPKPIR